MSISQGHQEKSRLGQLLVNRGYLSEDQLEKGLRLQRDTGQRLGELLIQAGWVSEQDMAAVTGQGAHEFLDSDFSMAGIEYDNSRPRYELRQDGALELAFPTRIERISMDNIRVRGGYSASMGSISLHDIRFHPNSSMVIRTY